MAKWTYHIIEVPKDPRLCCIEHKAEEIIKSWRLGKGVPLGSDFPPDAQFQMDKRSGNIVTDFLCNILALLMISPKMRKLMEKEGVTDVEYLPFVLLNKKGKVVSREYCVANLLGGVECVDPNSSDYMKSRIEPDQIGHVFKLNLLFDKIPDDKKLFRLREKPRTFIIRSDFLAMLRENDVTGLETLDLNTKILI